MVLLFEHLLVVLGVLAVAAATILALQQRRSPQSSAAWILFIVLMPYVALPIFLVLGVRKQGKRFVPISFASTMQGREDPGPPLAQTLTAMGAPPPMEGHRMALHTSPDAAAQALNTVVASAQTQLDVVMYIVARDRSGRGFVRDLTRCAQQGVRVRLNIDRLGTLSRPRAELAAFVAAGGQLRFGAPFLSLRSAGHLNLRDHRKLVIADGARVWAGGRNVGDEYLQPSPKAWVDLSYDVSGPVAQAFQQVFEADWAMGSGAEAVAAQPLAAQGQGAAHLQLVPAGPDVRLDALHDGLVSAIHRAERRVWLATPYFVPTEALSLALCTAARRGVDVRVCVPNRSNQWTADLARGPYLRQAERAGCTIRRFAPGMMHAKAGLIDQTGWVGSANFDVRSMLLNFELTLFAYDGQTVAMLEQWFAATDSDCLPGVPVSGPARRLLESVFRLGAPIL